MDRLTGNAYSYAADYAGWWFDGGREPDVEQYVTEDDSRFTVARAKQLAAHIRASERF